MIVAPGAIEFDQPGGQKAINLAPRADYVRGNAVTSADLSSVIIAAAALPQAANRILLAFNGEGPAEAGWQQQFADLPSR